MEQEWITDRLPTEADGDMDGDVRIPRAPGSHVTRLTYWSYVQPGMDWQHTCFWKPPAEPAPAESDRIHALEQRLTTLEQLFWAHKHEAKPVSIPAPPSIPPEAQP